MSTRYAGEFEFDHGAQFFIAKTPAFQDFLKPLVKAKIIAPWEANFCEINGKTGKMTNQTKWDDTYPHYVGTPRMNVIGKHLAKQLTIHYTTHIKSFKKINQQWQLSTMNNQVIDLLFDWVITTTPNEQALSLLPTTFSHYKAIQNIKMLPCFALMLGLTKPLSLPFNAALVRHTNISWISCNNTKPGRKQAPTLLVHASNAWAESVALQDRLQVKNQMLQTLQDLIDQTLNMAHSDIHYWKYANCPKQTTSPFYLDTNQQLAAIGDWCIQGRVEAAFTSGFKLAQELKKIIS